MKIKQTITDDDEPGRSDTVYNIVIKHDDSGMYLEWLTWQVEARTPTLATEKVLRLLAADENWNKELDSISIACVPLRSFRFRRGTIEERPPRLTII